MTRKNKIRDYYARGSIGVTYSRQFMTERVEMIRKCLEKRRCSGSWSNQDNVCRRKDKKKKSKQELVWGSREKYEYRMQTIEVIGCYKSQDDRPQKVEGEDKLKEEVKKKSVNSISFLNCILYLLIL